MDANKHFRHALGAFATGVTVITTLSENGSPVGVTASSFNSVSLDPPLVLWSLAKTAGSRHAFCSSGHFAIHVLSSKQEGLSGQFASAGTEKFAGIAWDHGQLRSPIIDEYAALFECRTSYQYEGGDHIILVGEVINFDHRDEQPLLFHAGQYADAKPREPVPTHAANTDDLGFVADDFLFYLLSRSYTQLSWPTRDRMKELGLSQTDYLILAFLGMNSATSAEELTRRLARIGVHADQQHLDGMVTRRLVDHDTDDRLEMSEKGRSDLIQTLVLAKSVEEDLFDHFTAAEIATTKSVLRKLIELTNDYI